MGADSFLFVVFLATLSICFSASIVAGLGLVLRWALAPSEDKDGYLFSSAYLFLVIVAALTLLAVPTFVASNHAISDSAEYAVAAERIVSMQSYTLRIGENEFPPRYAPWFSGLVLAPALLVTGRDLGHAVLPVTLFALLGVAAAFCIGKKLSGNCAGVLAAASLLLDPGFRYFSGFAMTDVPVASLSLLAMALMLLIHERKENSPLSLAALGGVLGLAAALRPTAALLVLPALFLLLSERKVRTLKAWLFVLAPLAFMAASTVLYSLITFGSLSRSGYQFWLPWPYDEWSAVFSTRYLKENLEVLLFQTPLPLFLIVVLGLTPILRHFDKAALNRPQFRFYLIALALFAIPSCLFYLLYFYSTSRFALPVSAVLYAGMAASIGALLGPLEKHRFGLTFVLVLLIGALLGFRLASKAPEPERRLAAERISRNTPSDAIIVTALDPVYSEPLLVRGTKRVVIPVSRRVEYASKVVAWKKLDFEPPSDRNPESVPRKSILRAGGQEAVAYVALEAMDVLREQIRSGAQVYLDESLLTAEEMEILSKYFVMQPVSPKLYRLTGGWEDKELVTPVQVAAPSADS